ncbi:FecCD family ABC transporter permease [Thiobacter aerophilum]|uniref:Iron ABC transporter permease n=1 Tax=Thiobacter aerophilum TaxID=3121275 RepID=A0ABV0EIC0_9BURK
MRASPVVPEAFRTRRLRILLALAILAPVVALVGLFAGSVSLSPAQILAALLQPERDVAAHILWELRAPRVAAAFACGALLSVAGLLLQVLVRNPLAEPYVLGIAGGAALGALTAVFFGAAITGVQTAAFAGALVATAAVFLLSGALTWNPFRLLLTGVVLSAGFGAGVSLLLALAPAADGRGMLFWLMGDLGYATAPVGLWLILVALLGVTFLLARGLDVLAVGELQAQALGVAVRPLQVVLFLAASLATAVVVAQAGPVGFVGLIVPHALRLAGLSGHRWLLPAAALAGGSFLTLADLAARTVAAPQQLPVGVFTALIGVPVLLWLLASR